MNIMIREIIKIIMLSIALLFANSLTAFADDVVDANSTDFLNSVAPTILSESIMPVEKISDGGAGPYRAIDGIYANNIKNLNKSYQEADSTYEVIYKKVKDHYTLDQTLQNLKYENKLSADIASKKAKTVVFADHKKGKLTIQRLNAERKINERIKNYNEAIRNRESALEAQARDIEQGVSGFNFDSNIKVAGENDLISIGYKDFAAEMEKTSGIGRGLFAGFFGSK